MTKQSSSTVLFAVKIGVKLLLICGIVALLLAAVNHITKPVIAQKEQAEEQQTLKHFFPSMTQAQHFPMTRRALSRYMPFTRIRPCWAIAVQPGQKGFPTR